MPLFETLPIDKEKVCETVLQRWSLDLGKCLKASQNHTFEAHKTGSENKYIVRVTPDPANTRVAGTEVEIALLRYLKSHGLPVCASIPPLDDRQNGLVAEDNIIIVAFEYAVGEPVLDFKTYKWLTGNQYPEGIGRWMAKFHALSKRFVQENPDVYDRTRHWTELHDGVLKGVPVDPADVASASDPHSFGLIHGDVNLSNFLWQPSSDLPVMFDWDQLQRSWFLYDLSSPIWTVITMKGGGSPVDRSPVPQADPAAYTDLLVKGYEAESGAKVDRAALERMIQIRRQLYVRFCSRAVHELPEDHEMAKFCRFMNSWLSKE